MSTNLMASGSSLATATATEVTNTQDARDQTVDGDDEQLPQQSAKRKAKDALAPDSSPTKRIKVTPRSMKNPYQVFSNLLPRRAKKSAIAKMPKIPLKIQCQKCGQSRSKRDFDCEMPCVKKHVPTVCISCTRNHISDALVQGSLKAVSCPTCQSRWDDIYLRRYFSGKDDERYQELSKHHRSYRPCLAPNCSHGQIHNLNLPRSYNPMVVCNACGAASCFSHKIPWHEGLSCGQYYDKIMEEREKAASKTGSKASVASGKNCPDCTLPLAKIKDTNSVLYCVLCGRKRCSDCLVNQIEIEKDGNHKHAKTCKYWAQDKWDHDNDVKRGLKQLEESKKRGQRHLNVTLPTQASSSASAGGPSTSTYPESLASYIDEMFPPWTLVADPTPSPSKDKKKSKPPDPLAYYHVGI